MFRIKICGVTQSDDVRFASQLGVEAIGLNFYEKSPRYIDPKQAGRIRIRSGRRLVGVFVNADAEEIRECVRVCRLDAVQLHGDEPPEFLQEVPKSCSIIRARRIDERGVAAIAEDFEACRSAGRVPQAVLVDAFTPGRYGGTGETVCWTGLADYKKWLGDVPLILAGGLTPENVAEAIRTVRPYGVDTASGVESSPGVKDHEKMQSFVKAAQSAFEQLDAV
jgi:phosphoribosylanthranilate isomerase